MLILDIAFCRGKVESCSEGIVESLLCCALAAGKIEKKCSNINYCCSSSNVHKCNSTNVKTKARVMEMGATSITASCFCKQFDSYVLEGITTAVFKLEILGLSAAFETHHQVEEATNYFLRPVISA